MVQDLIVHVSWHCRNHRLTLWCSYKNCRCIVVFGHLTTPVMLLVLKWLEMIQCIWLHPRWVLTCTQNFLYFFFLLLICHYWQWPILINCVMCYYLCNLRWLMRPILALNCLLQIEQERYEEESSVGDALALAFRSQCRFLLGFADSFCFVFTSSPSYEASPLCTILCNLLVCWSL